MENWQLALVILVAIMVGVLIPALVRLNGVLGSIDRVIKANERDLRHTLQEIDSIASHVNRLGSVVESNSKQIKSFFESLESIGDTLQRARTVMRTASVVGAAVGPALASAIRVKHEMDAAASAREKAMVPEGLREQKKNGVHLAGEEKRQ